MSATLISDVSNQVQKKWSGLWMDELMETAMLASVVNKAYENEITQGGDTVYVSQINRPAATRRTVGSNHDTFETTKLSTSRVAVVADQVFTAAYEFDSLVQLQSQIGQADSQIRKGLLEALEIKVNEYLYSLVSPSTSAPDHSIASVTDFNATQLNAVRKLASQAKWKRDAWYCFVDPSYMSDLLAAQTLTSSDYVEDPEAIIAGQMARKRFGFMIYEDNSSGMAGLGAATGTEDLCLAFHPDFMHLVLGAPQFEISSLHSQKRHGFLISVTQIGGAVLGIDGAEKHIVVYNT